MNAKIREAQMMKVPYVLVVGDKEMEDGTVSVRLRGKRRQLGVMPVADFVAHAEKAVAERALE
jgi:threonyl-tRNA synthetase